jgi:small-conductance mechanosensitive channel
MVTSAAEQPAAVELPDNLTAEEVRDLIARLSDDQVRELIIRELDKQVVAEGASSENAEYFEQLNLGIHAALDSLALMFDTREQIHHLPTMIGQQISDNGRISSAYLWFQFFGLMVAGFAAERLARRLLEKSASRPGGTLSLGQRFDLACYGAGLGLVELGAFAIGAFVFIAISGHDTDSANQLWYEVTWCLVYIKLVLLAVRQVAAPSNPDARLAPISNAAATQALGWTLVLASVMILPQPLLQVGADFGATEETLLMIRLLAGLILIGLLIVLIVRLRDYGRQLIAGDDDSSFIRQSLGRIWWMLAIGYVILVWLIAFGKRAATGESTLVPGLGSLFLFVLIPYFDAGLKWLISRYFEATEEETPQGETSAAENAEAAMPAAASQHASDASASEETGGQDIETTGKVEPEYVATALRYARVLMVLAILAIFVRLWDINLRAISALLVGEHFAAALFDISITILLAWALWGVIRISIERKLVDEKGPQAEAEEVEAGGLGGTRVETVLPLIRIFIKITLIVMAVLISLSALGVNIGPLIAGAGVVGIAIGFGAQTLVRDIVSGFFYLIDDAFRIGEYVVIDQIRGTVEKISVRSFQLRHHNGPVHTIPYGEIRTLTNWSRDWSIMKFELRIPFETDIEMVRKLIKKIGLEMMEDPLYGPLMLQPVKSQGVNRMDDSALIIRCKFTSIPGQQYLIRREAFTRIQKAFEEKGIQFAPRRVLVEATNPQEAVKAAAAVIDREGEGEAPPKQDL